MQDRLAGLTNTNGLELGALVLFQHSERYKLHSQVAVVFRYKLLMDDINFPLVVILVVLSIADFIFFFHTRELVRTIQEIRENNQTRSSAPTDISVTIAERDIGRVKSD